MAGEFLYIIESINTDKIRSLSDKSDETIKIFLAKEFLDLFAGFNNISKKQYKRELAEFLKERGICKKHVKNITNLSERTIKRIFDEK